MVAGFSTPGIPWNLLYALYLQGTNQLHVITTGISVLMNEDGVMNVRDLVQEGRVAKITASFTASPHPSRQGSVEQMIRDGIVEAEVVPQGTLAERIRSGGAGIPAFYTPAGASTLTATGKECREFDGRTYVMERALVADYAFIHAYRADTVGNLIYRLSARNYNPLMAMAARTVIVEVEEPIVEAGELRPDNVHTPGVYVSRLVQIPPGGIRSVSRRGGVDRL